MAKNDLRWYDKDAEAAARFYAEPFRQLGGHWRARRLPFGKKACAGRRIQGAVSLASASTAVPVQAQRSFLRDPTDDKRTIATEAIVGMAAGERVRWLQRQVGVSWQITPVSDGGWRRR